MKRKNIRKIILIILSVITMMIGGILLYNDYRIKHAKVIVILKKPLTAEVYSKKKASDYIIKINGKILKDEEIDTTKIGKTKVRFTYINEENITISYTFEIEVKDTTKPLVSKRTSLTLHEGYNGNIMDNFFCGDNYDANVKCNIVGEYDVNKVGSYPVIFEAVDSSENKESYNLNINIIKKETNNPETKNPNQQYTYFSDVLKNYKTKNNKIGIDVSKWEENIDFEKVKNAGVEFAYIRVGYQKGKNGEYMLDPKFKQNILGFKSKNIKVGVYFFSHASTEEEAIKQANWVYRQIRDYKIDLEVVFDWENWSGFSTYKMSFYNLTNVANTFIKEIENRGYKGMLYSSKFYLENAWLQTDNDIWLAHYTDKTDYEGKYKVWQLCEYGKIDGIEDFVDIDIMYN